MRLFIALFTGVLFGLGLSISQMINPSKVLNFLDIFGNWDPSLMFVMGGGLIVNVLATWMILKRPAPVLHDFFHVPARKDIDWKLVSGAGLFGIGWGLAGYCPGPLVTSLSFVDGSILSIVLAYIVGTIATKLVLKKLDHSKHAANEACVG